MRFTYSFQKIVDLKSKEKKQAETGLSEAIGEMTAAERELSELVREKHLCQERLFRQDGTLAMSEVIQAQRYVDYLEECIQAGKRRIHAAEMAVEQCRQHLTDRTVDEKVWVKAKEKAYSAFRTGESRRVQYELDEIATQRAGTFR